MSTPDPRWDEATERLARERAIAHWQEIRSMSNPTGTQCIATAVKDTLAALADAGLLLTLDTTQAGTRALDAAIGASVLAYDAALNTELRNPPGYVIGEAGRTDLARSAPWRAAIEAAVRAAAPLIPVSEQQRADIERDALLRAARTILDEAKEESKPFGGPLAAEQLAWDLAFVQGMRHAAHRIANDVERSDRARAASVGTEEDGHGA
jgi:hypothetical protein